MKLGKLNPTAALTKQSTKSKQTFNFYYVEIGPKEKNYVRRIDLQTGRQ